MAERQLTIPGRLEQIERICHLVSRAALDAGFDRRMAYACALAVNEACENIILHGYGEARPGKIQAVARAVPGELTIELEDTAPPFNPAAKPPPPPGTWKTPRVAASAC